MLHKTVVINLCSTTRFCEILQVDLTSVSDNNILFEIING